MRRSRSASCVNGSAGRACEWGDSRDALEDVLVADGDTSDVVRAIRLDRVDDCVTLPLVRRRVGRDGVVAQPDGHVDLGLLDGLELAAYAPNELWVSANTCSVVRTTNAVWLQSAPYRRICWGASWDQ